MGFRRMKHVLWTGGWDSTFRVLFLLLIEHETVQPHYIIDPERKSKAIELHTLEKIRNATVAKYPDTVCRFLRPLITNRSSLLPNEEITRYYQKYSAASRAGSQYEWLCLYAGQCGVNGLELCVERGSHPNNNRIHDSICGNRDVVKVQTERDSYYAFGQQFTQPEFSIFRGIRFPLLDYTKSEMAEIALKAGFDDLMDMTWFCHTPDQNGKPCGVCRPCQQAKMEGLGWRVPKPSLQAKVRHSIKLICSRTHAHQGKW